MAETRQQREAEREREKGEFTPRMESADERAATEEQTLDLSSSRDREREKNEEEQTR